MADDRRQTHREQLRALWKAEPVQAHLASLKAPAGSLEAPGAA